MIKTNRREFIKKLLAAGLTSQFNLDLDLDRLLWIPGVKKIFLPYHNLSSYDKVITLEIDRMIPYIQNIFEQDNMFYKLISKNPIDLKVSGNVIRIPLHTVKGRDEI